MVVEHRGVGYRSAAHGLSSSSSGRYIGKRHLTLKDSIFLTDEELYSALYSHIHKEYSAKTSSELTAQQKIDTARYLHFNYNATNQQLRRMLKIELAILEELFP